MIATVLVMVIIGSVCGFAFRWHIIPIIIAIFVAVLIVNSSASSELHDMFFYRMISGLFSFHLGFWLGAIIRNRITK